MEFLSKLLGIIGSFLGIFSTCKSLNNKKENEDKFKYSNNSQYIGDNSSNNKQNIGDRRN